MPPSLEAAGYVGNFETKVEIRRKGQEIKHGATIIATGAEEYRPTEYLYGQDDRVMTQLELEEKIAARRREAVIGAQSLVMIQCVGCRQEDRNYCAADLLQPGRQERPEAEGDEPGDGYLHSLPGHENLRVQRGLLPRGGEPRM